MISESSRRAAESMSTLWRDCAGELSSAVASTRAAGVGGAAPAPSSAAADCLHDLHAVAVAQSMRRVPAARDDVAIDLDRHAPLRIAGRFEQFGNRERLGHITGFAVQMDAHAVVLDDTIMGQDIAARPRRES